MAESAGLEANIQPLNTGFGNSPGWASVTSKNAVTSGGSVGGVLVHVRAVMRNEPNRTVSLIGALMVEIRAVTLSRP